MAQIPCNLPRFLTQMLDTPPGAGAGVHRWLFSCARHLHAHMPPSDIAELLAEKAAQCGRHVPWREICAAVRDGGAVAWTPQGRPAMGGGICPALPARERRWPAMHRYRREWVLDQEAGLAELCDSSAVRPEEFGAGQILDLLFPGDPLLCCGESSRIFDVRPKSRWLGQAERLALIVPSPMTSVMGETQEGKPSRHTLNNTGPRHYLICEFDSGTPDDHAGLLMHLAGYAPLVCAVHSGGKSLHGWFQVRGYEESRVEWFFRYAVKLGADPATWTRSQFVRMPNGTRENGRKQGIYYLNPAAAAK